jgi:DNA invertase Pin-like site-specific DNA recombinase
MKTAVAYYRTSSATNVGEDKDSEKRQREACTAYAAREGIEIVHEYYDAAVKGTDAVGDRKGFAEMLSYMLGNGARTILIENASRFARDLAVQLTGHDFLKKNGIDLIPVDCPHHFTEDTPTAEMVRQILGAVSQFEKRSLVEKMKKARERKRRENGRCEGRKPAQPAAVAMAKELAASGMTLRAISERLAAAGFFVMKSFPDPDPENKTKIRVSTGRPYKAQSIKAMLKHDAKCLIPVGRLIF